MPITDGRGRVQGCVTSFTDLSELHRAHAELQAASDALKASKEEVQRQNVELQRMATRDPLTGCLNRRAFNDACDALFAAARADHKALSCLILDIDHFKRVNDTHGHAIGDRVIQETARKLNESARGSDLVCRYGGEEFVVVLPGMDAAAAVEVGERVRARIEAECGPAVREVPDLRVTISVGVATLEEDLRNPGQLVDHADQALYHSKRTGRNRVTLAPPFGTPFPDASQSAQAAPAAASAGHANGAADSSRTSEIA
jgi:diguanylate cyclase (GGDEF)-like protein